MRSTFNILFYVNKSKVMNGVVPVMGRVTINGTQSQFSCKKSIPLDMWDVKGNCAKGRSKEALQINRELDNIKAQIIKHYQHLSDREAFVTAEMVRNSYQGFGSEYETLLSAFDKDIANQKKRVGKDRVASTLWAMDNIVDINGDKWIIGHRHKTGIPFQVKLMDVPLQIIDRYKHLQEDKLVFGKMTYSPTLVLRPHCVALSVRSYTTSLPLMTSMRMSIFLLNFYKRNDAFYILWLIVSLMLDLRIS